MSTSDQAWSEEPESETSAPLPTIRRQAAPVRQVVAAVEEPEEDEEGDFDLWIDDETVAAPQVALSTDDHDQLNSDVAVEHMREQQGDGLPDPDSLFLQMQEAANADLADNDLPDPDTLFLQMQGASQAVDDDLPDPDTLFLQMQGASQAVDDDLPDPDTLFLQMQGASQAVDDDLPDPDALFLQMQGASQAVDDDLPDPDALFLQMQGATEAVDDDLPDPDTLFLQMQGASPADDDLPDPDALFLQMQNATGQGDGDLPDPDTLFLQMREATGQDDAKILQLSDTDELSFQDPSPVFLPMPPGLSTASRFDDSELFLRLPDPEPDSQEALPPILAFRDPEEQPDPKALPLKMRSLEATEDLLNLAPLDQETEPLVLPLPLGIDEQGGEAPGVSSDSDVFDLPDPDSLFLQMRGQAEMPAEPDLPDPNVLFQRMQAMESLEPSLVDNDLPDPNALFLQMQAMEAVASPTPDLDLPDPNALFLQMQAHLAPEASPFDSSDSADPWVPPLPEPQIAHPRLDADDKSEDKGSLFSRLKAKFTKDKGVPASPGRPDPSELLSGWQTDEDPPLGGDRGQEAASLPDPAELFRRLQAGELDPPMVNTPDGLPALPDLDALRAEMEAEERASLDADLLSDLSGPERFADTVSDLAFNTGTFFTAPPEKGSVHKPPQQRQDKFVVPPKPFVSDEPVPAMLSKPTTPKPELPPARPAVQRPSEPPRPAAAYQATPRPPRSKSASTAIMPKEGAETKKIGAAANFSERVAKYRNRRKPLSRQTLCIVTRQMSAMIKAGISMHQALAFCAESDPVASPVLEEVCGKIESGYSMSGALREYPETFDAVYVGLVHAGELSGRMNEMLAKLADILERELDLRKRMVSVVTYPAVLLAVSMLGTLGFIFFVLPQLTPLFMDLNVELPWPTKVLLSLRTVLLPLGIFLTTALMIVAVMKSTLIAYIQARPSLERRLAYIPLGLPVIGKVYEKLITARVLYSLATMLEVGVTMSQALARVEGTTGNAYVGYRLARARIDLADGCSVTECFQVNQVFPDTALQLIAAGEESARLVDMFTYVARHFDEEVEQSMDAAAGLLEPLIMVVMGLIVGFITIAAALPTIKLLQGF
jgi:type IV pilus assembly protein PilC